METGNKLQSWSPESPGTNEVRVVILSGSQSVLNSDMQGFGLYSKGSVSHREGPKQGGAM